MINSARFCEHCGAALPLDARFCNNCGQPVAGSPYSPPPSPQPYMPQPAPAPSQQPPLYTPPPARHSLTWLWILLGILALVGICAACLLLTGVGAYILPKLTGQSQPEIVEQQPAPLETSSSPEEVEISPSDTPEPTVGENPLPIETTELPAQPSPLPADTRGPYGIYLDDFSDMNSGWPNDVNDNYSVGYFQQMNYAIGIFQPDYTAWVKPPHHLEGPFQEAIIQVNVKPGGYGGIYGIFCGFQDKNNYYQVSFSDNAYSIGKLVDGEYYRLTDPEWLKADSIQNVDDRGYIHLIVNCMQGSIGVEINSYGQKLITDPDTSFPYGNVALFASAGPTKRDGVYNQTLFDDFKLEVNPQ
jgi:hypothetical protein